MKDYKGYMVRLFLGPKENHSMLDLTLVRGTDDGTWGDHIIVKLDNVPYSVIPIINRKNLRKLINGLQKMNDDWTVEDWENDSD